MRERRHQQRAVDTDGVHGCHHVVAGDLRRSAQNAGPGSARMIAFVGVHLGIDCQHGFQSFTDEPPRGGQAGARAYFSSSPSSITVVMKNWNSAAPISVMTAPIASATTNDPVVSTMKPVRIGDSVPPRNPAKF